MLILSLLFWIYTIKWYDNIIVFFKLNDVEKKNYW